MCFLTVRYAKNEFIGRGQAPADEVNLQEAVGSFWPILNLSRNGEVNGELLGLRHALSLWQLTEVLVVAGAIQGDSHPGAKGVPIGEIIESALVVIECLDLASRHDGLA